MWSVDERERERERGGDDCIHGTLCLADGWMDGWTDVRVEFMTE